MEEPLGVLLLPRKLEEFELQDHARGLLEIPRVVALEPSALRPPRLLREALSARQARRLRFPGVPRLLVVYHPLQYPLARALRAYHDEAELWYVPPDPATLRPEGGLQVDELLDLDRLAREHARRTLTVGAGGEPTLQDESLRVRLRELGVVSPRPFFP